MVLKWLFLALNSFSASIASPIQIGDFLNVKVSPYLSKQSQYGALLAKPIDPRGNQTSWDLRLLFDPQTHQYSPSTILNAEYVQQLFQFSTQQFTEDAGAVDFLGAKEGYYRQLAYSPVLKQYLLPERTLSDWGNLNHPPLHLSNFSDFKRIDQHFQEAAPLAKSLRSTSNFQKNLDQLTNTELSRNNRLRYLTDTEVLSSILRVAGSAKRTLWGSSLLFTCDQGTKPMVELLKAKAKEGVDVRVLLDWTLQKVQNGNCEKELAAAGVKVTLVQGLLTKRSAYHMKMWISDFDQAIIYGANMMDQQMMSTGFNHMYHDSGIEAQGPVVSDIASTYLQEWSYANHKGPADTDFAVELAEKKKLEQASGVRGSDQYESWFGSNEKPQGMCRFITQDRHDEIDRIFQTMTLLFSTAQKSIYTSSVQQFVKPRTEQQLKDHNYERLLAQVENISRERSIRVEWLLNSNLTPFSPYFIPSTGLSSAEKSNFINSKLIKMEDARVKKLLQIGSMHLEALHTEGLPFRAWSYFNFAHLKSTLIDGDTVIGGSYNMFSPRSDKDAEDVLICQDPGLALSVEKQFVQDLANSVPFPYQSQMRN